MEIPSQAGEFSLDLANFEFPDFVNTGHDLDMYTPTGSGHHAHEEQHRQGEHHRQQHMQTARHAGLVTPDTPALTIEQLLATQTQNPLELPPGMQPQSVPGSTDLAPLTPDLLKERLEQHMKIQQLQQLQTQILQQQIEMLRASNDNINGMQRNFHTLPTPGSSSEINPTINNEFMSPMLLQYMGNSAAASTPDTIISHVTPLTSNPTMSAPAALAFQTSPSNMDFELSPLTSPWLSGDLDGERQNHRQSRPHQAGATSKRNRSNSSVDDSGIRKKAASVRTIAPRTPRRDVAAVPSPVDMGPPAPPPLSSASSASSITSLDTPSVSPDIAPVTPASIMNIGLHASGLIPPAEKATIRPKRRAAAETATATRARTTGERRILPHGAPPASAPGPPLAVRKSSHKVAEQKRRDSLKVSFDELRALLPPLSQPIDEVPLPGAAPPRGPPRGDDGPNRAVSKLALLRCGNEFIRELIWRIDRRDEEIDSLRAEVRRLSLKSGEAAAVALDRDLDVGYEEVRRARKLANRGVEPDDEGGDDEDD